jgi:hypothetical protein
MIRIGGDYYIRSIQKVNPDRSLSLYCAIEDGLVLTIGKGANIVQCFEEKIKFLIKDPSAGHFGIFCDCILRKVEIKNKGLCDDFNNIFSSLNFIGFNTYGEQFNSIHINQTLTGIILHDERK